MNSRQRSRLTVEDVSEWLEQRAYRAFERQRAQVDTAKLIATFSAGISGTLVATALQVKEPTRLDTVAALLLACTVAASLVVIVLDRLTEADHGHVLELSEIHGWDEQKTRQELRVAILGTVRVNASVVNVVRWALGLQLLVAAGAAAVAVASLLQ
jgi:hypothetical protein